MTRVAGDPFELRRFADLERDVALGLVAIGATLRDPLPSMPSGFAAIVADVLQAASHRIALVADGLMEHVGFTETAAGFFELADTPGLGQVYSDLGSAALAKAIAPDGSLAEWTVYDWLGVTEDSDVYAIAAAFTGLSGAQRDLLIQSYPAQIGSLDGAPLEMRFAANRILVSQAVTDLTAERDRLTARIAELSDDGWRSDIADALPWTELSDLQRELDFVSKKLATVQYLATDLDDRQILLFEAFGDGRVAEVFGDLGDAAHVAFVVPGITNDLGDYRNGLRVMANRLFRQASLSAGDVAVVSWLGYNPPDSPADGAFPTEAYGAAEDLRRSVDGIRPFTDPVNVTVVGHSYGSVVTGRAIRDAGLELTDAVFVGSPGVALDVDHRDDLGSGVGHVWVAEAPGDIVPDLPFTHGPNPADDEWGGLRFETNAPTRPRVEGHSHYFLKQSESLRNIARIIIGDDDKVTR